MFLAKLLKFFGDSDIYQISDVLFDGACIEDLNPLQEDDSKA